MLNAIQRPRSSSINSPNSFFDSIDHIDKKTPEAPQKDSNSRADAQLGSGKRRRAQSQGGTPIDPEVSLNMTSQCSAVSQTSRTPSYKDAPEAQSTPNSPSKPSSPSNIHTDQSAGSLSQETGEANSHNLALEHTKTIMSVDRKGATSTISEAASVSSNNAPRPETGSASPSRAPTPSIASSNAAETPNAQRSFFRTFFSNLAWAFTNPMDLPGYAYGRIT